MIRNFACSSRKALAPWFAGFCSRPADMALGWCLGMLTAVGLVALKVMG